ncbi:hypothetical protein PDO_1376 [Rhizobium sp. PDO1-076]|nr:hypothetical protein PDO_1376 [Rhizobium sp. PDO1-076]
MIGTRSLRAVELMMVINHAIDSIDIMTPGKIIMPT